MSCEYVYQPEQLPSGFKYPRGFLEWTESAEVHQLYPWIPIKVRGDISKSLRAIIESQGRQLVPFASLETGDGDAACFDGKDVSGNPEVLMLILDESGRNYSFQDFEAWLKAAREHARKWRNA